MWCQTFGHNRQIEHLRRAMRKEKLHHAFLFCGLEGIGKGRVATGLAQALNCEKEVEGPCEQCTACQKTAKNIHPDCERLLPDGKTIKVESLRAMKQKAYLHPLEGRAKVFIIDPAEAMTPAGANALLKILEEPPAQTFFILMTSRPGLLLPTIRSRCQRLDFQPLPDADLQKILAQSGFSKEEAQQRVELAQGSALAALEIDWELYETAKGRLEELESGASPSLIFELGESFAEEDQKLSVLLKAFCHWTRQKLLHAGSETESERCFDRWLAARQSLNLLETSANKRLLLEDLLFTLTT